MARNKSCFACGKSFPDKELAAYRTMHGGYKYYCRKCNHRLRDEFRG